MGFEVMADDSGGRYNPTIDSLKGFLIVLVVVGHCITQSLADNALRWAIYSFHMPVFIGLGGFLLNHNGLRSGGLSGIWRRYGTRVIVPWLILFIAYTFMVHARDPLSLGLVADAILMPTYHTWYVPVFLFFVAIASFISRTALFPAMIVATSIGAAVMIAFGMGNYPGIWPGKMSLDPRYFTMAPYFFFGLWLRQSGSLGAGRWGLGLAMVAGVAVEVCFFRHVDAVQIIPNLLLNFALVSTFPWLFSVNVRVPLLQLIGWNSLYFYLWHPFIIAISKRMFYKWLPEASATLITVILIFVVMFIGLALIQRSRLLLLVSGAQARRKNHPDAPLAGQQRPLAG